MARYDPEVLKRNIERMLEEPGAAPPEESATEELSLTDALAPPTPSAPPRSTPEFPGLEHFWHEINPSLQANASVDQPPAGTRMAFFKRLFLRLLRPVAGRQATYNYQSIRAMEALARQADAATRVAVEQHGRLLELQAALANAETSAGADRAAIAARVEEVREALQRDASEAIEGARQAVQNDAREYAEAARLSAQSDARIFAEEARLAAQTDARSYAEEVRESARAERVESEERFAAQVQDNASSIWKGLEERSTQIGMNIAAVRQLQTRMGALETELREARARLLAATEQQAVLFEKIQKVASAPPPPPAPRASTAPPPTTAEQPSSAAREQLEIAYLRFQREFRGDIEQLRARQVLYVERLNKHIARHAGATRILDVACGDGIFVELLRENGFNARGVDINGAMVRHARDREVPVEEGDAIASLHNGPEGVWHAITAMQFVEHLTPEALVEFLRGVRHALAPGGILIVETLNPHSLAAHKWFHLDLSHEHLVFPEMLQLLAETVGLRYVTHEGINPVAEWDRLKLTGDEEERANLKRLDDLLYGPQDYYLVARKPE